MCQKQVTQQLVHITGRNQHRNLAVLIILTKRMNKLNDLKETRSRNENVKHAFYHDYYDEDVIYLI
jgi:hypothetical protein